MEKVFRYLILSIVVVIIISTFFILTFLPHPTPRKAKSEYGNFEIKFPSSDFCDEIPNNPWKGLGYCFSQTIDGEEGVIVLHPISVNTPSFIYNTFEVPKDSKMLKIKVANLAGKIPFDDYYKAGMSCPICDSLVKIVIFNTQQSVEDQFIITNSESWVEKSYDITSFLGKITIVIYSIAGGTSDWNGEWLGIGSIDFV